ncbi:hypothetical protein AYO47_06235 [Planctomyces sp. SCGC AG-212-M04]|nr:hypothetical protein AYO47_06235 [Planctomyces sp. SCGC AG-212-M04]
MSEPRIIVAEAHGHWNAWFEDRPYETFGGDMPGTAVERLWANDRENRIAKRRAVASQYRPQTPRWRIGGA